MDSQDLCLPLFVLRMDNGVMVLLPILVQVTIISNFVYTGTVVVSRNYYKRILFIVILSLNVM